MMSWDENGLGTAPPTSTHYYMYALSHQLRSLNERRLTTRQKVTLSVPLSGGTSCQSPPPPSFKKRLKTHLFHKHAMTSHS